MTRYVWDHSAYLPIPDHKPQPRATVDDSNRLVYDSPTTCIECGRQVELVHPDDVLTDDERAGVMA